MRIDDDGVTLSKQDVGGCCLGLLLCLAMIPALVLMMGDSGAEGDPSAQATRPAP